MKLYGLLENVAYQTLFDKAIEENRVSKYSKTFDDANTFDLTPSTFAINLKDGNSPIGIIVKKGNSENFKAEIEPTYKNELSMIFKNANNFDNIHNVTDFIDNLEKELNLTNPMKIVSFISSEAINNQKKLDESKQMINAAFGSLPTFAEIKSQLKQYIQSSLPKKPLTAPKLTKKEIIDYLPKLEFGGFNYDFLYAEDLSGGLKVKYRISPEDLQSKFDPVVKEATKLVEQISSKTNNQEARDMVNDYYEEVKAIKTPPNYLEVDFDYTDGIVKPKMIRTKDVEDNYYVLPQKKEA